MNRELITTNQDNSKHQPPDEKPKNPIKPPPDSPNVPPNRSTPPNIEDPKPDKPKKIV